MPSPRIFISYSSIDQDTASYIHAELLKRGADVFIDYRGLMEGDDFHERLAGEIKGRDIILFLVSANSIISNWVKTELKYAFLHHKQIVPLALDNSELPDALFFVDVIQRRTFERTPASLDQLAAALGVTPNPVSVKTTGSLNAPDFSGKLQNDAKNVLRVLPPPFEWCYIPPGRVTLEDFSAKGGTRGGAYMLDGFALAKYPVTNAQYDIFVIASDGFADAKWWDFSDMAREWRASHSYGQLSSYGNEECPRVSVTWYEAVAFTRWLAAKCEQPIYLPSEQEWQRAAQGDSGYTFPWGNDFDAEKCNCSVGINPVKRTTPVTKYANGKSIYGVMDMSGNVSEWTATGWGDEQVILQRDARRVLRGGSWNLGISSLVRAGHRDWAMPDDWNMNVGFRVARAITP